MSDGWNYNEIVKEDGEHINKDTEKVLDHLIGEKWHWGTITILPLFYILGALRYSILCFSLAWDEDSDISATLFVIWGLFSVISFSGVICDSL